MAAAAPGVAAPAVVAPGGADRAAAAPEVRVVAEEREDLAGVAAQAAQAEVADLEAVGVEDPAAPAVAPARAVVPALAAAPARAVVPARAAAQARARQLRLVVRAVDGVGRVPAVILAAAA